MTEICPDGGQAVQNWNNIPRTDISAMDAGLGSAQVATGKAIALSEPNNGPVSSQGDCIETGLFLAGICGIGRDEN
jgi:hypothetical protein